MDLWPSDDREPPKSTVSRKGKGKRRPTSERRHGHPLLQPGSLGAASLRQGALGSFEWAFAANEQRGRRLEAVCKPALVFPATRSPQPDIVPKKLVSQHADQGAQFLRTFFPDVDIPEEIIRAEVAQDSQAALNHDRFDPSAGDKIAAVHYSRGLLTATSYLVFPMGPTGSDLNVSPFNFTQRAGAIFKPYSTPSFSFNTPILQVATALHAMPTQEPLVVVRSMGATSVLKITKRGMESTTAQPQVDEVAKFGPDDSGGRSLVDTVIQPHLPGALFVNDEGNLFRWTAGGGHLESIVTTHRSTDISQSSFWRICSSDNGSGCVLACDTRAHIVDFRASGACHPLYTVQQPNIVTSVERHRVDGIVRLATTDDVIWVDERFTKRPLLAFKHGREQDRTLRTYTTVLTSPLTFLTSRKNGLVTVYDVSRSEGQLLQSHVSPYALQPLASHNARNAGHCFFRHPSSTSNQDLTIFQLSESGSIHSASFEIDAKEESSWDQQAPAFDRFEWSTEMSRLHRQRDESAQESGPLGGTEFKEVHLSAAFNRLFNPVDSYHRFLSSNESLSDVYELIDKIPRSWQEADAPIEQMSTTFDLAFRSGNEPSNAARADFLTSNALDSTAGFKALIQDRIDFHGLQRSAAWHRDLGPTLRRLGCHRRTSPRELSDSLKDYDLTPNDDLPIVRRAESEAREQLTVDLSLSTNVYSAHAFPKSVGCGPLADDVDNMSVAAGALSLEDEPPPVSFRYLRPMSKSLLDGDEGGPEGQGSVQDSTALQLPIGVRLLLQEWDVGSDPRDYQYKDPYGTNVSDTSPIPRRKVSPPPRAKSGPSQSQPTRTQSQTLPQILTSRKSPAPPATQPVQLQGYSQPNWLQDFTFGSQRTEPDQGSGQDFMTSTQVLPGPYGGRQSVKKKPAKKRVGGF